MISESLYCILHTFLLDLVFSLQLISLSTIQKFIKVVFVFLAKTNPFSHLSVKNSKKLLASIIHRNSNKSNV